MVSSVSGPVKLAGNPRVVTADRDLERLVTGSLDRAATVTCPYGLSGTYGCRKLVNGPFVLTDVVLDGGNYGSSTGASVSIGAAGTGESGPSATWTMRLRAIEPSDPAYFTTGTVGYRTSKTLVLSGGRWVVKEGESLVVGVDGRAEMTWSGFRPY